MMQKAQVRANEYFWYKFTKTTGLPSPFMNERIRRLNITRSNYLQIITSDNITPHCNYKNNAKMNNVMSNEIFNKGIFFAENNGFIPVILGHEKGLQLNSTYLKILSSKEVDKTSDENNITVFNNNLENISILNSNCILLINRDNIQNLYDFVFKLSKKSERINIILKEIEYYSSSDLERYENQLDKIKQLVYESYKMENPIEINVLTDILNCSQMSNCGAGLNTFALAPNGKIYICPAFYFDNPVNCIGDLDNGINFDFHNLLRLDNAPICQNCDSYHCKRCVYLNRKLTNEFNTPPKIQCQLSHIERKKSKELQEMLGTDKFSLFTNILNEVDYLDPFEKIKISEF
jgi:CXXX repeat peptide maturase